jgi:hypothetical protein
MVLGTYHRSLGKPRKTRDLVFGYFPFGLFWEVFGPELRPSRLPERGSNAGKAGFPALSISAVASVVPVVRGDPRY